MFGCFLREADYLFCVSENKLNKLNDLKYYQYFNNRYFFYVYVLKKRSSNGTIAEETRNVLLYNGKIHLNLVQQLFDVHIVEMKHGKSSLLFNLPNCFSENQLLGT